MIPDDEGATVKKSTPNLGIKLALIAGLMPESILGNINAFANATLIT